MNDKQTTPENKRFLVMKEGVIYDLNKIDKLKDLKLDFFQADYFLTRKESKPYLCSICKLNITCQNNFDYDCIETSDFLFNKKTIFTVKDDFLDSLIDKSNTGLRDKKDDVLEKDLTNQLTSGLSDCETVKAFKSGVKLFILLFLILIIWGIISIILRG